MNIKSDNTYSSVVTSKIYLKGDQLDLNEYHSDNQSSTNSEICFNMNPYHPVRNSSSTLFEYYVDPTGPIKPDDPRFYLGTQYNDVTGYVRMNRQ